MPPFSPGRGGRVERRAEGRTCPPRTRGEVRDREPLSHEHPARGRRGSCPFYVTGGRRIGGMESHLLILASNLPPSIRCVVCCLDASVDYLARLTDLGIEHTNLDCPNVPRPRVLRAYRRLTRVVRRFDPHVVHSYGFSADVIAALLRLGGAKRLITSRRGEEPFSAAAGHPAAHQPPLGQDCVRLARDRGVRQRHRVASTAPARGHSQWRGAASRGGPASSSQPRVDQIRDVGHGETDQGHRPVGRRVHALRARASRRARHRRLNRPAVGRGAARARSSGRAYRFVGRSSTPRDFLAGLDVFVLPSSSEGMSNALLEAMASGLPCIATDVGSNRSVLCPAPGSPGGVIAEATVDSLFRAMCAMAESRGRPIAVWRARAPAIVRRRHGVPAMISQYERLYRSVLGLPCATPVAGEPMSRGMTVDA